MRNIFLILIIFVVNVFATKIDKLVIAGPVATISHPLFHIIQENSLKDIANKVEFRLWQNPDELRAILLKKRLILLQFY